MLKEFVLKDLVILFKIVKHHKIIKHVLNVIQVSIQKMEFVKHKMMLINNVVDLQ